jgi:hypothetical protein
VNEREVMWTCAICYRMGAVLVSEGDGYFATEDRIIAMHKDVSPECRAERPRYRLYDDRVSAPIGGKSA